MKNKLVSVHKREAERTFSKGEVYVTSPKITAVMPQDEKPTRL